MNECLPVLLKIGKHQMLNKAILVLCIFILTACTGVINFKKDTLIANAEYFNDSDVPLYYRMSLNIKLSKYIDLQNILVRFKSNSPSGAS